MLDTMSAVMYRLISLAETYTPSSLDELMRSGLLVFAACVFLHWEGVRMPFTHSENVFREALLHGQPVGCPDWLWV